MYEREISLLPDLSREKYNNIYFECEDIPCKESGSHDIMSNALCISALIVCHSFIPSSKQQQIPINVFNRMQNEQKELIFYQMKNEY